MSLPFFGSRAKRNAELEEEIRSHVAMAVRERVARGEDPAAAARAVRREFGNVAIVQEVTRMQWGGARIERALRELRQSLRALSRAPAFTVTAVLVLGLGIGLATAVFTVFDAVLVHPLPVSSPERVVLPRTLDPAGVDVGMTQEELRELGASSTQLEAVAGVAHQGAAAFPVTDGDRVLSLRESWVTGGFFELLGVRPALGRFFSAADERPTGQTASVVVLSHDAWRQSFGGDSSVIGRRLGSPYTRESSTIIGVAPPGLAYPAGTELWTPTVYPSLDVVARLAPGATPESARTEFFAILERIASRRTAEGAAGVRLAGADIETFADAVLGDVRPQLIVLGAAVALLLLIACVNVGNLVLLRATRRGVETAVRRSIGAGSGDIVRPLLWESVALVAGGGVLGLACARGMLGALARLAPPELPRLDVLRLSPTPLGLAATVTGAALLLAGLIPALAAARGGIASPLRLDARSGRASPTRRRLRDGLVASQIALALVMLAGAGLLVRSLDRLGRIPLGYRPEQLSIVTLARPVAADSDRQKLVTLYERIAPALRALPGVHSITPVAAGPFYGPQVFTALVAPAEQAEADARRNPLVGWEVGGAEYFRTFDIPLLRGRGFEPTNVPGAPPVVVVSRSVAAMFWPGADPVGKRLRFVGDTSGAPLLTVIGEAADIRYKALRSATPMIFLPWRQMMFFQGYVAIRTTAAVGGVLPALRGIVHDADPEARLAGVETMDGLVGRQLALPRLSTLLLSAFGLAALLLAAIGLYGVMATSVREQTAELGIRAALGASPAQLRTGVLEHAGTIAATGAAVGIAAALAVTGFLRSLLFEVRPTDPAALAGAAALLLAVALLAAGVPAWRATRADPMRALKAE